MAWYLIISFNTFNKYTYIKLPSFSIADANFSRRTGEGRHDETSSDISSNLPISHGGRSIVGTESEISSKHRSSSLSSTMSWVKSTLGSLPCTWNWYRKEWKIIRSLWNWKIGHISIMNYQTRRNIFKSLWYGLWLEYN